MIKIEKVDVWGFEHAVRGMRNPLNSWERSDSTFEPVEIGQKDHDLMTRLSRGGSPHRKFFRQIMVSLDITAPLYWWKEFDTYKVGTTANSCSTMHTIQKNEFTMDDFSVDHLDAVTKQYMEAVINSLNINRQKFLDSKDKKYWWNMIQLLPTSFNQKRTVTMNYENLLNILEYRKGHKLDEWNIFCDWIMSLPYSDLLEAGLHHEQG